MIKHHVMCWTMGNRYKDYHLLNNLNPLFSWKNNQCVSSHEFAWIDHVTIIAQAIFNLVLIQFHLALFTWDFLVIMWSLLRVPIGNGYAFTHVEKWVPMLEFAQVMDFRARLMIFIPHFKGSTGDLTRLMLHNAKLPLAIITHLETFLYQLAMLFSHSNYNNMGKLSLSFEPSSCNLSKVAIQVLCDGGFEGLWGFVQLFNGYHLDLACIFA